MVARRRPLPGLLLCAVLMLLAGCRALGPYRATPTARAVDPFAVPTATPAVALPPQPPATGSAAGPGLPAAAQVVAGAYGPLPDCIAPDAAVATVRYAAGWSLVAGPAASCLHGATAAYLVLPAATPRPHVDYLPVPVGAGLVGDQAYWVAFPQGGTLDMAVNTYLPQPPVPTSGIDTDCLWFASSATSWSALANGSPAYPLLVLRGARETFIYVPGQGYHTANIIPVGQAAWVWPGGDQFTTFTLRPAVAAAPACP